MTFTPGPWKAIDLRHQKGGQVRIMSDAPKNYHWIANVMASNPNASEDAAFIIRAVNCHDELVVALKRTMRALDRVFSKTPLRDMDETLAEANAAISKAEGK